MKWVILYDFDEEPKRTRLPCVRGDEKCEIHKRGGWCRYQLQRMEIDASNYAEAGREAAFLMPPGTKIFGGWNQDEVDRLALLGDDAEL